MRTLAILMILTLLVGCQDETAGRAIHVGMPMAEAKAILADAGAEETLYQLHPIDDADVHYSLGAGRALIVDGATDAETGQVVVSGLTVMVFTDPTTKGPEKTERVESFVP